MTTETRTIAMVQNELAAALASLDDRKREVAHARRAETDQLNRVNGLRKELTQLVAPHLDFSVLDQTEPAIQHRRGRA